MLIRRRHQQSFRRNFVRFTFAITTAATFIFLLYFHSSIDAFSLGLRTLPTSSLYNNEISNGASRARSPLVPFSRLKTKPKNDDDDEAPTLNVDDGSNRSGSSTPFFAEKTSFIEVPDGGNSRRDESSSPSFDSSVPFFGEKMNLVQTANTDTDNSNGDSASPYFGEKVEQSIEIERKLSLDDQEESTRTNPGLPIFLSKRSRNNGSSNEVQGKSNEVNESDQKTQLVLIYLQDIQKKLYKLIQNTKQTIWEREGATQRAISGFKILLGLEEPSLESRYERTIPMTSKEEARDLAGKVTVATFKLALWLGREVTVLAWVGSRAVYNNTVGPSVDKVWNDQLDSLNTTVNTVSTYVKSTPSRIKVAVISSIQRDSTSLSNSTKNESVPRSIQQDSDSASTSASATNDPAFVGRIKSKANRKNKNNDVNLMVKSILKSPVQLNKEREEDQKLANEISDALDLAERALSDLDQDSERRANDDNNQSDETKPVQLIEEKEEDEKFAKRASSNLDRLTEEWANEIENQKSKTEEMTVLKTPEELNKELQEAQELAKDISNAIEVAERALKLNPNIELEDPMIEIDKVNSIDNTEVLVPKPASLPSVRKKKITRAEKRKKRKERQIAMNAITKAAKSQDDLDAELMEAQSLAKEIADALDVVEKALKVTPGNTKSSINDTDEASNNLTP
mmetsp:Transcript_10634/g.25593  ORF Transcript_10634/g.25593 Transcript_10634/m.25593 type:complete len:683 (+) Transcript_10634:70-2118(+)